MEKITSDGGVTKKVMYQPPDENLAKISLGSRVVIDYELRLMDSEKLERSCEKRHFSFRVGSHKVIRGMEIAVLSMTKDEHALFHLSSEYAFGSAGRPPRVPSNSSVQLEIHVLNVTGGQLEPRILAMKPVERLVAANEAKTKGNTFFKALKYEKASESYQECLQILSLVLRDDSGTTDLENIDEDETQNEQQEQVKEPLGVTESEVRDVQLAALNNFALCKFKLESYQDAESIASLALNLDPENGKSLYYRGRARAALGNLEDARSDLELALQVSGNDRGVVIELDKVEKRIAAQQKQEKRMYGAMFA